MPISLLQERIDERISSIRKYGKGFLFIAGCFIFGAIVGAIGIRYLAVSFARWMANLQEGSTVDSLIGLKMLSFWQALGLSKIQIANLNKFPRQFFSLSRSGYERAGKFEKILARTGLLTDTEVESLKTYSKFQMETMATRVDAFALNSTQILNLETLRECYDELVGGVRKARLIRDVLRLSAELNDNFQIRKIKAYYKWYASYEDGANLRQALDWDLNETQLTNFEQANELIGLISHDPIVHRVVREYILNATVSITRAQWERMVRHPATVMLLVNGRLTPQNAIHLTVNQLPNLNVNSQSHPCVRANNQLLIDIKELCKSEKQIEPLTPTQMSLYETLIEHSGGVFGPEEACKKRKDLIEYKDTINFICPITHDPVTENESITVRVPASKDDKSGQGNNYCYLVYSKTALVHWIETEKSKTKPVEDPCTRSHLQNLFRDGHITMGYPEPIVRFIKYVREMLTLHASKLANFLEKKDFASQGPVLQPTTFENVSSINYPQEMEKLRCKWPGNRNKNHTIWTPTENTEEKKDQAASKTDYRKNQRQASAERLKRDGFGAPMNEAKRLSQDLAFRGDVIATRVSPLLGNAASNKDAISRMVRFADTLRKQKTSKAHSTSHDPSFYKRNSKHLKKLAKSMSGLSIPEMQDFLIKENNRLNKKSGQLQQSCRV